jgi:hypothetical protein
MCSWGLLEEGWRGGIVGYPAKPEEGISMGYRVLLVESEC